MKIRLWCCTHDTQSHESELFTLDEVGITQEQYEEMSEETRKHLESVAEDFMWNEKQPEWGFEKVDE